jgi:hypothetical protein
MFRYKWLPLAALCVVFCSCPVEPAPELVSAEYLDSVTVKLVFSVPDGSASYEVSGETLSFYSVKHNLYYQTTRVEKVSDAEYRCVLCWGNAGDKPLIKGDRVRVNAREPLSGSVYFDVPE